MAIKWRFWRKLNNLANNSGDTCSGRVTLVTVIFENTLKNMKFLFLQISLILQISRAQEETLDLSEAAFSQTETILEAEFAIQ